MKMEKAELKERILKGLDLTYKKLLKTKQDRNLDLVISKNGHPITIDPKNYSR